MFINLSYSLSPLLNVKSKSMQVISKAPSAMASFSCSSRVCVLSLPIFSLSCYFDLILDPTAFSFFGHFELISGIFCSILIFFFKEKNWKIWFFSWVGWGRGEMLSKCCFGGWIVYFEFVFEIFFYFFNIWFICGWNWWSGFPFLFCFVFNFWSYLSALWMWQFWVGIWDFVFIF